VRNTSVFIVLYCVSVYDLLRVICSYIQFTAEIPIRDCYGNQCATKVLQFVVSVGVNWC